MQIAAHAALRSWLFKNKGKFALATLLLAFIIGGYCISSLPPEKGVFAFDLPAGYRISEITDKNCSIVDAKGTVIGGVILTDLRAKDIRNLDSNAFAVYLNDVVYGCEYFSWAGGDFRHPLKYVSQSVTISDTQKEKKYYRVFFVKNSGVYDMWFDLDLINMDAVSEFYSIAETKQ